MSNARPPQFLNASSPRRRAPRTLLASVGPWTSLAGLSLASTLAAPVRTGLALVAMPQSPPADAAPAADRTGRATIAVDPATNSLVIVGSEKEVERLAELARQAQEQIPAESSRVYSIRLGEQADPERLRNLVQQTLRTMTVRGEAGGLARRVSIVADGAGRSLVVAATPADFKVVGELVAAFARTPISERIAVRTYPLQNTTADRAAASLRELLQAQRRASGAGAIAVRVDGPGGEALEATFDPSRVQVIAEPQGNALVVLAPDEAIGFVDRFIESSDRLPPADRSGLRVFTLEHARAEQIEPALSRLLASRVRDQRRRDPTIAEPSLAVDPRNNAIIATGSQPQLAELAELLDTLDTEEGGSLLAAGSVEVVPVRFADANEVATTLDRFLRERAAAAGQRTPEASVAASRSANALVVGGSAESIAAIKALVEEMDLPRAGDRVLEIMRVRRGDAASIARLVNEQFSRRTTGGAGVAVSADPRTNSVIVNAPAAIAEEVKALVASLDAPDASDETVLRTYQLSTARADEAVRLLTASLQLDASGRADGVSIRLDDAVEAVEVRARIVADRRSNSLIVTATPESVPVVEALIARIDEAPASSPLEFRIVPLEHATAADASYTLRQMLRASEPGQPAPAIDYDSAENHLVIGASADQFPRIEELIEQLDRPRSRPRRTDFIALEFADADKVREALSYFYGPWADQADRPSQRSVSIVADPATNSLVISAEESEWEGIRGLLEKLDREDYDGSLQLKVFALDHADARGVARAINDAFRGQMEDLRRRSEGNQGRDGDRRDQPPQTTLVPAEDWVSAAAEENTNSIVVSASRTNLNRIERIIEELDTADFARLPAPRVIAVSRGDAEQLASAINEVFGLESSGRDRIVRVVGDRAASALIVRAGDEDYAQIVALAESLQAQSAAQGLSVNLLQLANAPAARIADALREAYALRARQANLPLSISVDSTANAIVVSSTGPLFAEIKATAEAMDALSPATGQAIFFIDLEHLDPADAKAAAEAIGLDKPQPANSVSRIVGEPIRIATLPGRKSLLVVASPADRAAVTGFFKAVDAAPALPESMLRVVRLEVADANAVARILNELIDPAQSGGGGSLAKAAREQIRRLNLRRDGLDEPDLALDLETPVRILADTGMNAILVDSSAENVRVVETLAKMLDQLPVTTAVAVQILPLENITAAEFARIVKDLFAQGQRLGQVAGTSRQAMPAGTAGQALLEPVAISVDERTNTVIVAGKEDAVAFVEVLKQRMDGGVPMGWVEPRVIALEYADAEDLAATLEAVLVSGRDDLPESIALRKQVARLRVALPDSGGRRAIEGDIFRPMSELLVRPDRQTNALVAVGSPGNLEIVEALVEMLDVEAAAPGATVRTYAVEVASAGRVAALLTQLFDQQFQAKLLRDEDRVRVVADERTNSIVVSTSPRSFLLVDELLKTLDAKVAPDLREIRTLPLDNAAATRVATIVQQMMDARLERLRRVQPETADLEKALVLADPRSNALIVAAGNDAFEVITRLARDLDAAPPPDSSLVEVVAVRGGDMARLSDAIERVMERRYADLPAEIAKRSRPLVLTDPRTGSLLVAASPEDVKAIRGLVEQLEAMPLNPALGLAVVQVENGQAETIAPRIQQLMNDRARSLGSAESPSDRVSIVADPASNSLLVAANESNVETVRELVRLIGESETDANLPVDVIMLARGRANEMLSTIRSMYVDEANRNRGPNTVRVSADERLNAIVVAAPPADVAAVRALVARLDGTTPGTVVEIKYIPLASANSLEMVGLVETVLSGGGIGQRRGQAVSTVVRYLRELEGDTGEEEIEVEISQTARQSISLTPDVRTNTVIVRAPRESMPLLERMIKDLDESSLGGQNIRVFRLANADADAMARILQDLFNLRQQGGVYVLRPRELPEEGEIEFAGTPGLSSTELTMVPDERQSLSITVDSRTNSLLVSGTQGYLELVQKVVDELDAAEANERETFVYRLKNATAEEVAAIIGQFVDEDQRKVVSTLGSEQLPSAARLLEREVTIVGDVKSNSVVVTASPRYVERVRAIIEELDVDPPQVLIQVLLAEVSLGDDERLGLEFTRFSVGSTDVAGGFDLPRAPFGSDAPKIPGLMGLAPALFASGLGVPNIAVGSADFDLLINALQSQNRVQVLSNPSVMVANNSEGFIQVGQTVRLPDSIAFSSAGQQSAVTPTEIGVILRVVPTINPDGYVRMDIEPEISRLSRTSVQISEDFESPVIDRRRANTTVTVKDGQTVVIGGLISDRYERIEKKIPLLGDIPLIGAIFRNTSETIEKTELLIVLTPHVISNAGGTDRDRRSRELSDEMIDKLNLDQALIDQIRRGELEGLQGETDAEGRRIDSIGTPSATREREVGFSEAQKGDTLMQGDGNPAGLPQAPAPGPSGSTATTPARGAGQETKPAKAPAAGGTR